MSQPSEATREKQQLILIGGGEHAVVVLDAAVQQMTWKVVGFVDPETSPRLEELGLRWLGDDEQALGRLSVEHLIITFGGIDGRAQRRVLAERYSNAGYRWAIVIHPSAVIAPGVSVGPGVAILARAVINPGARIGQHSIVNTGAIVEHDVDLGVNVQVGPGVVIGGGVTVGDDTFIGLGTSVRDHVRIGSGAVLGMGAVILDDVPPGARVAGVPARPIGAGRRTG